MCGSTRLHPLGRSREFDHRLRRVPQPLEKGVNFGATAGRGYHPTRLTDLLHLK